MSLSGYLTSLIRTLVPAALSAVFAWAALHWHVFPAHPDPKLVDAVTLAVFALIYAVARWLEERKGNGVPAQAARALAHFLLSLGVPTTTPQYPAPPPPPAQQQQPVAAAAGTEARP
jgi:hypothetical protein